MLLSELVKDLDQTFYDPSDNKIAKQITGLWGSLKKWMHISLLGMTFFELPYFGMKEEKMNNRSKNAVYINFKFSHHLS